MKKIFTIGLAVCAFIISASGQGFGGLKGKKTATAIDTTKKQVLYQLHLR